MFYALLACLPLILALGGAFLVAADKLWNLNIPTHLIGQLFAAAVGITLVNPVDYEQRRLTYGFFEDWDEFDDTEAWTATDGDAATTIALDADGENGRLSIACNTTDNEEGYIERTNENFFWVADKPMFCAASIQFTEVNVDDANVAFGFIDAPGANTIVDDGAGIKTSFSGAVIYKVDGGTVWKFVTSKGAVQTISTSDTTAGGAAFQELKIDCRFLDATFLECAPFVDGVQLQDANGVLIKHVLDYTSATQQSVFAGLKTGAAQLETLLIDWIAAYRKR